MPVVTKARTGHLANKAILVGLHVADWFPHMTDKRATARLAERENVNDQTRVRARKSLLPKEALKEVHSADARLRALHAKLTMPWDDLGLRLLAGKQLLTYMEKMTEAITAYHEAADAFVPKYPDFVKRDGINLGDMHEDSDYPPVDSIRKRFHARIITRPIPMQEDVRLDLGDEEVERLTEKIKQDLQFEQSTSGPMNVLKELGKRMKTVVQHAINRIDAYTINENGKVENTFKEAIIDNVNELLDMMPYFNVIEDAKVDQFAGEIRAILNKYTCQDMRQDSSLRKEVVTKTNKVISKMNDYFGGPPAAVLSPVKAKKDKQEVAAA
jgi:hypothetical protein